MKKLILGLVLAFAANAAMAAANIDNIFYSLDAASQTARIDGPALHFSPTTIDVVEVEWDGKKYSVTSIFADAFSGCRSLESVSLPLVTWIDMGAFSGCTALKTLIVNSALKESWESMKDFYGIDGETVNPLVTFYTSPEAIGGIKYEFDVQNRSAKITGYDGSNSPTNVVVGEVEDDFGRKFTVTLVDENAFRDCSSLTTVSLPLATTIGDRAFQGCENLTSVSIPAAASIGQRAFHGCDALKVIIVNKEKKQELEDNRSRYVIYDGADILVAPSLTKEQAEQTSWDVEATFTKTLKCGGKAFDEADYQYACEFYGLTAKQKPEDPQLVQEGEVAVKQTELQAAKAEAVTVADGVVSLGVTVNTNGNFTAETKSWAPVELKPENVKVENGKIVISIPVSDKSGFMILQSGDAKVSDAAVTHEPWYTPTVED